MWRTQQDETEIFRARLRTAPRFEPRRLAATRPTSAPPPQMEFRRQQALPQERPELAAQLPDLPLLSPPELALALRPFTLAARPDTFTAETSQRQVDRAMGSTLARQDSLRTESLDLLRIEDLVAAGNRPAVILVDPSNRRDLTGFVTLRRVRLRGAGGGTRGLDELARHMRDHTRLLVQVDPQAVDYFLAEKLLADPIHFIIQAGPRDGALPLVGDWPLLQVSDEEKQMLGRYVRGGGLLFIEGSSIFLSEAATLLQELIGSDGGMLPLSPTHPVYHSFYDFDSGFPGEDKTQYTYFENMPPAWIYPLRNDGGQAPGQGANINPGSDASLVTAAPLVGLWGAQYQGRLVAILSDLGMHRAWVGAMSLDEDVSLNLQSGPKLAAGVNLVVYALTRPEGTAVRRALPAWAKQRPTFLAAADDTTDLSEADAGFDEDLYADLAGAVAVVRAPLGATLGPGSLRIRVGGHQVELFRDDLHGVLLNNLSPGQHWVEVTWQGKTQGAFVQVEGGQVSTMTLSLQRLAMFRRITLRAQTEVVGVDDWLRTFDDLTMEEVFLEGEEIEAAPPDG